MTFDEIMQEMVESVHGGYVGTVMAMDGIPLGQYMKPGAQYAMDVLGVEYSKIIDEVRKASSVLHLGHVNEVTIDSMGTKVALRLISDEYFVAFIISNESMMGKARFRLRVATNKAKAEM